MDTLIKRAPIPITSRIKPYYDTKEIVQNTATYNFFPATATRNVTRDNYIGNPFPGEEKRRVVGISFELVKQFIRTDSGNGINAIGIVNGLKDGSVILTADNDYKEFLRISMEECSNFLGTGLSGAIASAFVDEAIENAEEETACMKSASMYALRDPFDVAPTQSINLQVTFKDASVFPTSQQWTDSGQGVLLLRSTLYLAEIQGSTDDD